MFIFHLLNHHHVSTSIFVTLFYLITWNWILIQVIKLHLYNYYKIIYIYIYINFLLKSIKAVKSDRIRTICIIISLENKKFRLSPCSVLTDYFWWWFWFNCDDVWQCCGGQVFERREEAWGVGLSIGGRDCRR